MRSCDPQSNVMAWKANLCSTGFDSFGGDGLCLAPSFPSPRRLSLPVSIPRLFHLRALCLTRRTLNQIRSFHLPPSRLALRLQALGLLPIIANAGTLQPRAVRVVFRPAWLNQQRGGLAMHDALGRREDAGRSALDGQPFFLFFLAAALGDALAAASPGKPWRLGPRDGWW
jgi:hypothetical protein